MVFLGRALTRPLGVGTIHEWSHAWIAKTSPQTVMGRNTQLARVEEVGRLADHEKADMPYRAIKQFRPSTAELKQLAPKLGKLAE